MLFVFYVLFWSKISLSAERVARGEACPSNSCFCTDCHHRDIYSSRSCSGRDISCLGNCTRCHISFCLHLVKMVVPLDVHPKSWLPLTLSRSSWSNLRSSKPTILDICIVLVSIVNVVSPLLVTLHLSDPTYVIWMAYLYTIENTALIAGSLRMFFQIHANYPHALWLWRCKRKASTFTAAFLGTTLVVQVLIVMVLLGKGFINPEQFAKQQMLFYVTRVFLGATLALVSMCRGSTNAFANQVCEQNFLSFAWLFVVLFWLAASHFLEEWMAKNHLWIVILERVFAVWHIRLMAEFSKTSLEGAESTPGVRGQEVQVVGNVNPPPNPGGNGTP